MLASLILLFSVTAAAPSNAQVNGLSDRAHELEIVLHRLDQADGPDARVLMEKHWSGVQDYMAALLRAMPPLEARTGEPDCRIGGTWNALALPAEVDAFRYRSVMHARLLRALVELREIRGARDRAERALRAQAHWNAMYEGVQALRGLGWMFGRWLPAERTGRWLPEPDSDGAKAVARYCSQCHALPPPSLHTSTQWHALVARMAQHMERADTPIPVCVSVPSAAEVTTLRDYLEGHAR